MSPLPSWSPDMMGVEPFPDNILLNGRNGLNCSRSTQHQTYPECSSGSFFTTRVQSQSRVRLRIISHSSNLPIWFTVDNHTLEIVEVDGVEIEPIATTRVFVNPGQRYSVLLTANQTAGNYLMRASAARNCAMLDEDPASALASVNYEAKGIISYNDVRISEGPIGRPWSLDSKREPLVGAIPWTLNCRDIPFDIAKPMRRRKAYGVGARNQHHFTYKMSPDADAYHTYINGVSTIHVDLLLPLYFGNVILSDIKIARIVKIHSTKRRCNHMEGS